MCCSSASTDTLLIRRAPTQHLIAAGLVALLAACGGGGGSGGAMPPPVSNQTLGLMIDTPNLSTATQAEIDAAVKLAVDTGAKGIVVNYPWSSLERQPGRIDVTALKAELARYNGQGLQIYVGIQVINTVKREVPADLATTAFNDPAFIARFHALFDAIRTALTGGEKYITIGNEVDAYLSSNPAEWVTYQMFYEDAVAYIHTQSPALKVGVTTTIDGYASASSAAVHDLNIKSDVVALTYYPIQGGSQVRASNAPATDFPTMVNLAAGRPVVLQEVGFPSGAMNGSSEQSQSAFVTSAFQAWRSAGTSIPFMNYFILYDFDAPTCAALDVYYGLSDPAFTSFLCTLGLKNADGTDKAAWSAFVAAAK